MILVPSWTAASWKGDPHSVIEGMIIAGYAIGASRGYVYVQAEYPWPCSAWKSGCTPLREWGLLGENIFGSGFSFDINIKQGAGAFVSGEETALIASIEGQRRYARSPNRPFLQWRPVGQAHGDQQRGDAGNVPRILRTGSEWFRQIGTTDSREPRLSLSLAMWPIPVSLGCPWASPSGIWYLELAAVCAAAIS